MKDALFLKVQGHRGVSSFTKGTSSPRNKWKILRDTKAMSRDNKAMKELGLINGEIPLKIIVVIILGITILK